MIATGKVIVGIACLVMYILAIVNFMELSHVFAPEARALEDLIILVRDAKASGGL